MNAMAESRNLIREMEQILSDQVGTECPACGAECTWVPDYDGHNLPDRRIAPDHSRECVIVKARQFLGKED